MQEVLHETVGSCAEEAFAQRGASPVLTHENQM